MLDFAAVDALLPEVAARLRAEFEDASELPDADLHAFLRPVLRRAALNGFEDADDGFVYAAWRADVRLADELPGEWEGRDVVVTGVVASLPQNFERGVRFVFEPESAEGPVPRRISLAWYRGFADDEWHSLGEVHAGVRVQLSLLGVPLEELVGFGFVSLIGIPQGG